MSAYLIDTRVWLWMQTDLSRVRASVLELLASADNDRLVSAATVWEIAIKYDVGKLALPQPPDVYLRDRLRDSATTVAPIDLDDAVRAAGLPLHHKDPFDRMIVAQAQLLGLPLVTVDPVMKKYDIDIIDA
ncbi:type II toxin-antitoxin system VapC family toxin [Nocardioides sp. AN3]